jgi:HK97 family phage major capsid protein
MGGQPDTLLGHPAFTDPNVEAQGSDARIVAFLDFASYYLRTVGDPIIERNDSVLFTTDQVAFRGKWRVDGNMADSNAISSIVQNV